MNNPKDILADVVNSLENCIVEFQESLLKDRQIEIKFVEHLATARDEINKAYSTVGSLSLEMPPTARLDREPWQAAVEIRDDQIPARNTTPAIWPADLIELAEKAETREELKRVRETADAVLLPGEGKDRVIVAVATKDAAIVDSIARSVHV